MGTERKSGVFEAYLVRLAPSTQRVAAGDLRTIGRLAFPERQEPAADLPWHALGVDQGGAVRASLAGSYAPGTANRMLTHLRGVIRAAWRTGLLPWDEHVRLLAALPSVRGGRLGRGRALSWPEVGRLLGAAPSDEARALLALAVGAGLRRAELTRLTWDRCRRERGVWYLRVLGKGNRERRLRLPTWASQALDAWSRCAPDRPEVFRWRNGKSVWRVVDRAAARAGIGAVAPHDLRRTFASLALATGIGLADLRRMMGHASVGTTIRYDHRSDDAVAEAAARLDDPGLYPGPNPATIGGR